MITFPRLEDTAAIVTTELVGVARVESCRRETINIAELLSHLLLLVGLGIWALQVDSARGQWVRIDS